MYGERRSFAPVQVGEEVDVKIEAVGEKGDGIARKQGFVLFVPNTKEGEEVRIKITKVLRKVGFAEVVGQAQGPVGEDSAPAREEAAPVQPEPAEPAPEDSEDFGEEPAEESAPEEPAEEPAAPEAPAPDAEMDVPPAPEAPEEEKKEE